MQRLFATDPAASMHPLEPDPGASRAIRSVSRTALRPLKIFDGYDFENDREFAVLIADDSKIRIRAADVPGKHKPVERDIGITPFDFHKDPQNG